jgi:hypothetical protein
MKFFSLEYNSWAFLISFFLKKSIKVQTFLMPVATCNILPYISMEPGPIPGPPKIPAYYRQIPAYCRLQTMALPDFSPAINKGTAANAPAMDQRGLARIGVANIGAFEFGAQ